MNPKIYFARMVTRLNDIFGWGQIVSIGIILLFGVAVATAVLVFMNFAAPNSITITSGPKGSSFERNAEKYKEILAREGVTLNILPSEGSVDNFKKLSNPKVAVDVGFVLGGEVNQADVGNLVSLGSISYLFYRLRGHICFVRNTLLAQRADAPSDSSKTVRSIQSAPSHLSFIAIAIA